MARGFFESAVAGIFKVIMMPQITKIAREIENDPELKKSLEAAKKSIAYLEDVAKEHCKKWPDSPACKDRAERLRRPTQNAADVSKPYTKKW